MRHPATASRALDKALRHLQLPHAVREYQKHGILFFLKSRSALLADEMGLGKTVQTIVAIRLLRRSSPGARVLVVAPRPLIRNWQDEFHTWAPDLLVRAVDGSSRNRAAMYHLPIPVVLASYEQMRLDGDLLDRSSPFDAVVLDEAQRIKDRSSSTSLACRGIPRARSWALTGTPLENRIEDLISIFSFLDRKLLFRGISLGELHKRIKPHFLRRTKSVAAKDMPPIVVQDLRLELVDEQKAAYDKLWRSRLSWVGNRSGAASGQMLALLTKLKQLCNFEPITGSSVKLEALRIILENANPDNQKVILFSQYVQTLNWLRGRLPEHDIKLYHGGMDNDDRESVLTWFRKASGPAILFMSIKSGGVGLNLREASAVVMFDRWWNPALEAQAVNRAHRLGRTLPLLVYNFLCDKTIESRIEALLLHKRELFARYVANAPGYDPRKLSGTELRRLLALPITKPKLES